MPWKDHLKAENRKITLAKREFEKLAQEVSQGFCRLPNADPDTCDAAKESQTNLRNLYNVAETLYRDLAEHADCPEAEVKNLDDRREKFSERYAKVNGDLAIAIQRLGGTTAPLSEIAKVPREFLEQVKPCLLYTSPSPRDKRQSRMPSSA